MRPVLECAARGEVRIGDVVDQLADRFELTDEERDELLPSGKQTRFANRVHWAKSYVKQGGLVRATRRAHFAITDRGKAALADPNAEINNAIRIPTPGGSRSRFKSRFGAPGESDRATTGQMRAWVIHD